MIRFWIFGAVITTVAIRSVIASDKAECDEKCRELLNDVDDGPHYPVLTNPQIICVCFPGKNKLLECGANQVWSSIRKTCVDVPTPVKPTIRITGCNGKGEPRRKIGDPSGCQGSCPLVNACDHTDHLPHYDCTLFCKCNEGIPIVMDCPSGLHFNPELQVCDWPHNAGCTGLKK